MQAQKAEMNNYLDLLEMARHEANHTHAVLWKFCDLDVQPQDRYVSKKYILCSQQKTAKISYPIKNSNSNKDYIY